MGWRNRGNDHVLRVARLEDAPGFVSPPRCAPQGEARESPTKPTKPPGDSTRGDRRRARRSSRIRHRGGWAGDDATGGIACPIVLGVSFGGMVALAYATRHPAHPAKLILVSTEAAGGTYRERRVALFERFGGPEVGALARRRFLEGHTDDATLLLTRCAEAVCRHRHDKHLWCGFSRSDVSLPHQRRS